MSFTYGSLGVKGDGDLTAGLGLLGSASIVDDRLVVLILALQGGQLIVFFFFRSWTSVMSTYVGEVPEGFTLAIWKRGGSWFRSWRLTFGPR